MEKVNIKIQKIDKKYNDIPLPAYATGGSSGLDIRAAVEDRQIISAGSVAMVATNLKVEIPLGYEIQIRPRSGLAAKHSIGVLNSPGTIDSDYRGEIKIILFNFGKDDFVIEYTLPEDNNQIFAKEYQLYLPNKEELKKLLKKELKLLHLQIAKAK